jgi:hypothetical protein
MDEWKYNTHAFLTSALDGNEWSASCPNCFTSEKRTPSTHLIGDWAGPRTGLDVILKKKEFLPCPCWKPNPQSFIP